MKRKKDLWEREVRALQAKLSPRKTIKGLLIVVRCVKRKKNRKKIRA